jgi:hypothetical protein
MRRTRAAWLSLLFAGCTPTPLQLDGGGEAGARRSLPSCVDPQVILGEEGLTSIMIDTRGGEPGHVDLPPPGTGTCTVSGSPAPQWVVAYTVPGDGPHAVEVSTINPGTDQNFDTVIAMRRSCQPTSISEPPDACFDDDSGTREFRSRGSFLADGGETVFLFVTGYGTGAGGRTDEGLAQLDITAEAITPPTITEASILITPDVIRLDVVGGDAGRDASGVWVTFHGPAGELLDIDANGVFDDGDVLRGPLDRPVVGVSTFTETATLPGRATGGASTAHVRLSDRAGVLSERAITVPARIGTVVGPGAACDATSVCDRELACDGSMVCVPAPDRMLACGGAIDLPLMAPTDDMATVATRQSVLEAGGGLFAAPEDCSTATGGQEDIFHVTVPAGRFDVILTTDSEGTSGDTPLEPDTILYVRRDCTDASLTSASPDECNDDIETGENQRSTVEIRDVGDTELFAFVEIYNGAAEGEGVRYEIAATLRPVLSTGAACDPAGLLNRCGTGTCPVATRVCP